VSHDDLTALGWKIVFRVGGTQTTGLRLAVPKALEPFLVLSPDDPVPLANSQFTRDGRFLIWGKEDGTVHVAKMDRVRESLERVGIRAYAL
jgi:hypothetical protein